jgi:hypothetical protein
MISHGFKRREHLIQDTSLSVVHSATGSFDWIDYFGQLQGAYEITHGSLVCLAKLYTTQVLNRSAESTLLRPTCSFKFNLFIHRSMQGCGFLRGKASAYIL